MDKRNGQGPRKQRGGKYSRKARAALPSSSSTASTRRPPRRNDNENDTPPSNPQNATSGTHHDSADEQGGTIEHFDVADNTSPQNIPPNDIDASDEQEALPEVPVATAVSPDAAIHNSQSEIIHNLREELDELRRNQQDLENQRLEVVPAENVTAVRTTPDRYADNTHDLPFSHVEKPNKKLWQRRIFWLFCIAALAVIGGGVTVAVILSQGSTNGGSGDTLAEPEPPSATVSSAPSSLPTQVPTNLPTLVPTSAPTNTPPSPVPTPVPTSRPPTILPNGPWEQLGQDLSGTGRNGNAGTSVALSKDASVVAVGAPGTGHVVIYQLDPSLQSWTQMGQTLVGQANGDRFGGAVALNGVGNIVSIGARDRDGVVDGQGRGQVQVFEYNSGTLQWELLGGPIHGESSDEQFGVSLSLSESGLVLATGASGSNSSSVLDSGSVRLFQFNRSTWQPLGQTLVDQCGGGFDFGCSLSLSSSGMILGIGDRRGGTNSQGEAVVFEYNSGSSTWIPMGEAINGDGHFGHSVSLNDDGLALAVGATFSNIGGTWFGSVDVFAFDNSTSSWTRRGQTLVGQAVGDFFGSSVSLSSDGNVLAAGSREHDGNGLTDSGNVRIFEYDKANTGRWIQLGSDILGQAASVHSGISVSLSGNGTFVAIGSPEWLSDGNRTGFARVFILNNNSTNNPPTSPPTPFPTPVPTNRPTAPPLPNGPWAQLGLDINGKGRNDNSGASVALSKDASIVAVGAPQDSSSPGYVIVYRLTSSKAWAQVGQELVGQANDDGFGSALSLNGAGTIVAIGAGDHNGETGQIQVFAYNSTGIWEMLGAPISGEASSSAFGNSVSLSESGFILAAGAEGFDSNRLNSGSVRLFQWDLDSQAWQQLGQTLMGQSSNDRFGSSVSLSNSGMIVGIGADGAGNGEVSVFQFSSGSSTWIPMGTPINSEPLDSRFGSTVSLDDAGLTLAVGDFLSDAGGTSSGSVAVFAFENSTSTWIRRGQTLVGQASSDHFGISVSLSSDGNVLASGARWHDGDGERDTGNVRIFQYDKANTRAWLQVGSDIIGEAAFDDSGFSVSLSGDGTVVVIGSKLNDGRGFNSGHVRVFTLNN